MSVKEGVTLHIPGDIFFQEVINYIWEAINATKSPFLHKVYASVLTEVKGLRKINENGLVIYAGLCRREGEQEYEVVVKKVVPPLKIKYLEQRTRKGGFETSLLDDIKQRSRKITPHLQQEAVDERVQEEAV
ncbi:hypothetical protein OTU49_007354 [Cherax quadricarinatus]|uniref:Uncharacterized protein n=1 Tax=Cherax quadricarinatus TaxID=27406 RepID=A0AAW0WIN2_CHEQU